MDWNLSESRVLLSGPRIQWIELEPQLNRVGDEDEYEQVESHLDSGAAKSVCPREWCPQFPVTPSKSSIGDEHFRTATGARVKNEGDRVVTGWAETGAKLNMRFRTLRSLWRA